MEDRNSAPAHWYDGVTARRHEGAARAGPSGAIILEEAWHEDVVLGAGTLTKHDKQADKTIYAKKDDAGFRLILPNSLPPALAAALPQGGSEYGRLIDRYGLARASLGLAAISAVLVAAVVTAPDWLGPRIPSTWERSIGDAMVGDIDRRVCHTPEADAALAKLLDRVDPRAEPVRAGIANIAMINAVALPGEHVLLFDGIIQQAKTPDELAGVLAHEVGHVRERHVMTAMMRQFGLSVLLAGADSGALSNASGIATMGYSRDAESEADTFARQRLAHADISPLGAAGFFERMSAGGEEADEESGITGWLASHPAAGDRARAFRKAAIPGHAYAPALTAKEFVALKQACRRDRDVEDWNFF